MLVRCQVHGIFLSLSCLSRSRFIFFIFLFYFRIKFEDKRSLQFNAVYLLGIQARQTPSFFVITTRIHH